MKRNKPTPLGIELGAQLAKFADKAEQEFGEKVGFFPLRCHSCAYRKGTYPNGCFSTVSNALKCTMEGEEFYCHEIMKGHGKGIICAGWLMLNNGNTVKAPWDFIEGASKPNASVTKPESDGHK